MCPPSQHHVGEHVFGMTVRPNRATFASTGGRGETVLRSGAGLHFRSDGSPEVPCAAAARALPFSARSCRWAARRVSVCAGERQRFELWATSVSLCMLRQLHAGCQVRLSSWSTCRRGWGAGARAPPLSAQIPGSGRRGPRATNLGLRADRVSPRKQQASCLRGCRGCESVLHLFGSRICVSRMPSLLLIGSRNGRALLPRTEPPDCARQ